jgi:hypothetical protein
MKSTKASYKKEFGIVICLIVLVALYLLSYAILSFNGSYKPLGMALGGGRVDFWAPAGFILENGKTNKVLYVVYYPLLDFDRTYWHGPNNKEL